MATRKVKKKWIVDFRLSGDRYRLQSPVNTKAGAEAYETLLKERLMAGKSINPEDDNVQTPTFEQFAWEWFETYVKTNCKPSGIRTKESILRLHLIPWFGKKRLDEITNRDVEQFKSHQLKEDLNPKTINDELGVLSKCLSTAIEWEVIEHKPNMKRLRTIQKEPEFLSEIETDQLLGDTLEPAWNLMALAAVRTGLRLGELFGLKWTDVDFDNNQIVVQRSIIRQKVSTPKSNKKRYIPLTPQLRAALWGVRKHSGYMFTRKNGSLLTYSLAGRALERIRKRTGVKHIGWHALRHTFASQLVMKGVPIRTVQSLMGHSSITMTERYAHLAPSSLNDAIAVLEQDTYNAQPPNSGHYMGIGLKMQVVDSKPPKKNSARL